MLSHSCTISVLLPVLIQELCHYWIICICHINDCPFKFNLGFVLSFFFQLLHCSIEHICMNVEHKGQSSDYSFIGYQIFVCPDCYYFIFWPGNLEKPDFSSLLITFNYCRRTFQAEVFKSATNLFENLSSATQEIEIAVFWSFLSDLNYWSTAWIWSTKSWTLYFLL